MFPHVMCDFCIKLDLPCVHIPSQHFLLPWKQVRCLQLMWNVTYKARVVGFVISLNNSEYRCILS